MKYFILILAFCLPLAVGAQAEESPGPDSVFQARVLEITQEKETELPSGEQVVQQNLLLRGLEGNYAGQEVHFRGIADYDVLSKNIYQVGDKVLVIASQDASGNLAFFVTDYVRSSEILYLSVLFAIILVIVGRSRGLRSLISLFVSFAIIIKYLIPQILSGASPLLVTLISSLLMVLSIIYITEGFRARSHIAVISTFTCLLLTIALSWFFVGLARLSGFAGEEMAYLVDIGPAVINFKGLLLAGIIIGALGVLDDVVISQVVTVEQINKTDQHLSRRELFNRAYEVGVSHISSMTNTLFLAYAGVSLPLLILFVSGESAFSTFSQVINNEAIATEIVRTLAGSIGLILAVPLATFVAVWWHKSKI